MNVVTKLLLAAICTTGFFGDALFVLDQAGIGYKLVPTPAPSRFTIRQPELLARLAVSPTPQPSNATPVAHPVASGLVQKNGKYVDFQGHKYDYSYVFKDNAYSIRFQPYLAKGEPVLTGAMLEIIRTINGPVLINATPQYLDREGHETIKLKGEKLNFFFQPFKENNGEIWGITYWSERK